MRDARAMMRQQIDLGVVEVYRVHGNQIGADQAQTPQALHRAHAEAGQALFDLVSGLVQMNVDRQIELVGVGEDLLEAAVAHRVRRVRRQTKRQQRLAEITIARSEPFTKVVLRIGGVARREFDADHADHGAHARLDRGVCGFLRVEIHVVEAGDPALQHLGAGEKRSVVDEFGRHVLGFRRPDVLIEPFHQGQVVRQAAHERHGRMRVQIDEPGHQHVGFEADRLFGGIHLARLGRRQQIGDAPVRHHYCVTLEHLAVGRDGNDPAGVDQEVGSGAHRDR